jgi:hypothetical protein
MVGSVNVHCVVGVDERPENGHSMTLNADLIGTWSWPGVIVEVWNLAAAALILHFSRTPLTLVELIIRNQEGGRLSRQSTGKYGSSSEQARALRLTNTIQSGQQLVLAMNPLENTSWDAIRQGEYTVQAVFRYEDWQAVSAPTSFRVTRAPWTPGQIQPD